MLRVLVEAGADLKVLNKEGWNALHRAAFTGHHEALDYLLSCNAPIDAQTQHGDTALHLAAKQNFLNAVDVLVTKWGAQIKIRNEEGKLAEEVTNNESVKAIIRGEMGEMPASANQGDPLAFVLASSTAS